jgi:hypothetical protein
LAVVVEEWSRLPSAIRETVLTLIRTVAADPNRGG